MDSDVKWSIIAGGSALASALVIRNLVDSGYERLADEEPPKEPTERDTGWLEALGYGALSGALTGLARAAGRRAALRLGDR